MSLRLVRLRAVELLQKGGGTRSKKALDPKPRIHLSSFTNLGLNSRNEGGSLMKAIASAASITFLLCVSSSAQTLDDLKQDGNGGSTDNILTYGMGYHQHRYSPLKQIDKQTVKRLVPIWSL